MDKAFDPVELRPTRPPDQTPPPPWLTKINPVDPTILQQQTLALLRHPYDPSHWISRGQTLTLLGFPELAVGDAHKAIRLCRNMLAFLSSRSGGGWSLGSSKGFWMRESPDSENFLEPDGMNKLQSKLNALNVRAQELQASNLCYYLYHEGKFVPQAYPWLEEKHRVRRKDVVNEINREIEENETKTSAGQPCVVVKRCSFQPGEEDESDSAALGVFAACDLSKESRILVDRTNYFGCNGPGPGNSRENMKGGLGCQHPLHPNLASDEGEHDLRWVRDRVGSHAADPLLLCRTLLASTQTNVESPLDLPAIARLIPTYHRQDAKTFRLEADIEIINDALQQFGIDVFTNHHYDTWVLFIVSARLHNNSWTSPVAAGLNPLFSLFNHSCEPNVEWRTRKDHRTIEMRVSRDVVAGEQLFVEYDGYVHDEPLDVRRQRLARWIEGPCMCSRCVREEQVLMAMQTVDKSKRDGQIADTNGSSGSHGWLDINYLINKDEPTARPMRDTCEKPAFPEDTYWETAV